MKLNVVNLPNNHLVSHFQKKKRSLSYRRWVHFICNLYSQFHNSWLTLEQTASSSPSHLCIFSLPFSLQHPLNLKTLLRLFHLNTWALTTQVTSNILVGKPSGYFLPLFILLHLLRTFNTIDHSIHLELILPLPSVISFAPVFSLLLCLLFLKPLW